jgi:hypothetical protein
MMVESGRPQHFLLVVFLVFYPILYFLFFVSSRCWCARRRCSRAAAPAAAAPAAAAPARADSDPSPEEAACRRGGVFNPEDSAGEEAVCRRG